MTIRRIKAAPAGLLELCIKYNLLLFVLGLFLALGVVALYLADNAHAAFKPECDKELTTVGVNVGCILRPAGSFVVVGHSDTGYRLGWSVTCFDKQGNGLAAGGFKTINGNFVLLINSRTAPRAYRLMANAVHCGVNLDFRAKNPNEPHKVRGTIKWTHYLGLTVFHD